MKELLVNLTDNVVLIGIIVMVILIVIVTIWIVITNKRKKERVIPKKKVETIEEIMQEPVKPIVEDKSSIQTLLDEMAKGLEEKEQEDIETFEQEQEEKAIISYQELLKMKKNSLPPAQNKPVSTSNIEIIDIEEDNTNPIMEEEPIEEVMVKETSPLEDTKRFRTSEFISPVFGRSDTNVEYRTIDRTQIMAKLAPKETKPVAPVQPARPTVNNVQPIRAVEPAPQVKSKNIESMPSTRLSRLETKKIDHDEILDLNEIETTIKKATTNDEVKKNDEFLKALIAFRKNLQ